MATYYWVSTTPGANASAFAQWSLTPSGAPLGGWPGSSPDASDDFVFDHGSTANCNWDIAAVQSIQQSLVTAELYTGIITFGTNVALKGLILNGEITDAGGSRTLTFSGANLSALNDTSSRKRYVLNGQKAKHGSSSTLTYKIQPASNDVHLDNGPYNNLTIDTRTMTLAYSVPTASTHDNADDGTIHIKGAFVAAAAGGFLRASAPNGALDAEVKIKFDNTTFTYPSDVLDFNMATAFFRGTEIPVTGSQTYGTSANGFTTKHYGLVVFAASNGEQATIANGLSLNCYSLEVKAGARLTCASDSGKPVQINSQTQPTIRGVWSFQSSDGHTYISPRTTYVAGVGSGGTGLSKVEPNALLIGNGSSAMSELVEVPPGTNGYVLTMVGGTPAWAAASGGGGGSGTVTSVATSAPITGGTITTTGTIGISAATTSAAGSMSSADKTKLDGIETAADVTDATNVQAAGALMDSEVTNLAQVKAFDSADYATAAQGATADAALPTTGGTMTGEIEGTTITLNAVPADPATDDKVRLGESGLTQNMLRIQTNDGYLDIGPNNSGYSHFYTNRNTFYMNKPLVVDGGGQIFAYNDDLKLGTGTSVSAGTVAITVADGSTDVEVVGTLRQGNATSAVLVADANGDITAATTLLDQTYLAPGQAETDGFNPIASAASWAAPAPATIQEAIDRLAAYVVTIPGAPPQIP